MRNIAVFTCNRADKGPMGPVLKALGDRNDLNLWHIDWQDSAAEHPWIIWPEWKPDCLLVLGDRHELLGACHKALLHQVPIAHIHGGETTLGSFDDKVRNAVSQLASIHFTAAEPFTQKLVSMGVLRESIFTVGPPGLDDLQTDEISEFGTGFFLVCLHPDTTRDQAYNRMMAAAVCQALGKHYPHRAVIVGGNDDPGGAVMNTVFRLYADHSEGRVRYVSSLGRRQYLTALKHAAVCIGNSSSFVIEAPALGTSSVLVGDRQKGRPLAASILSRNPETDSIARGIKNAMERAYWVDTDSDPFPYGHGGASTKIAEILATHEF